MHKGQRSSRGVPCHIDAWQRQKSACFGHGQQGNVECPTGDRTNCDALLVCRGDQNNDEFRFASFFPGFVQPHVDRVADAVGKVLHIPRNTVPGAETFVPGATTLPGSDDAEAARRRWAAGIVWHRTLTRSQA